MYDYLNQEKNLYSEGLAGSESIVSPLLNHNNHQNLDQWFYLLNAPPQAMIKVGATRVFESAEYAQQWMDQNLRYDSYKDLALSFNIPFSNRPHPNPATVNVRTNASSVQKYIDFLIKEIQLFGKLLNPEVTLPYLHWFGGITQLLTASELTQLMFHINRTFKVLNQPKTRLVFELDSKPEASQVALLTGLGFNTACINCPDTNPNLATIEETISWLLLLRSYQLGSLYIRLPIHENILIATEAAKMIVAERPNGILLQANTKEQTKAKDEKPLAEVRNVLSENHYRAIHKNFYILNDSPDFTATHCLRGLGLGAASYTNRYLVCNTSNLTDYYGCLDSDLLPIFSMTPLYQEI